jgi:hypothetical protein
MELQNKIKEQLELILEGEFDLVNKTYNCSYSDKLEIGKYELVVKEETIASFELHPMINCCGICVSTKSNISEKYRNKGLGTILNSIRIDIARYNNYSLLLCTDIESNIPQRKILKANGWKDVHSFVNKRTINRVYLTVINL